MQRLLSEINACMRLRLFMPAVIGCLTVPDAAAAVEYGSMAPRLRYPKWFDKFVDTDDAGADGALAWALRNAVMHETSMNWRSRGFGFDRVILTAPSQNNVFAHRNMMSETGGASDQVLQLDLSTFVRVVLAGAVQWLDTLAGDTEKAALLDSMMQVRPDGLSPWFIGLPVIA